jgi:hypothetical protein
VASPTKNPIMKVTVDVKNAQATEKTRGSGMVAEGMIWPWPVFRLKWTKFRFVFRSKKAQISLLIPFYI